METPTTHRIPAVNFARLEVEVEKLNKRSDKLGCQPLVLTVVKTETVKQQDERFGFWYEATYYDCTLVGESPQLAGWTLVAILEPVRSGEMLVKEVPNQHCPPKFRTSDLHCDHCGHIRRRNAVYVLKHEVEGHKQVGRNCLADFLGHDDPESLLNRAKFILDIDEVCSDAEADDWGCSGGGRWERYIDISYYVSVVSVLIRRLGWVPRSKADDGHAATSDIAWSLCSSHNDANRRFIQENGLIAVEEDSNLAEEALAWARAISPNRAPNNYLHDLGVSCRQEVVEHRTQGFVASVVAAYQKHLEDTKKRKLAKRRVQRGYVGQIGVREVFQNLHITRIQAIESIRPKTLVVFEDDKGNKMIWWASGHPDWVKLNDTITVRATVEQHTEYHGMPQTLVKRVLPEVEKKPSGRSPKKEEVAAV